MITIGKQQTRKAIMRSLQMLFAVMKPRRTALGFQAERSGGVKASAYILLLALGLCSCEASDNCQAIYKNKPWGSQQEFSAGFVYTITQDSCEYVIWDGGYNGGIVHKHNCKFCKQK